MNNIKEDIVDKTSKRDRNTCGLKQGQALRLSFKVVSCGNNKFARRLENTKE